MRIVCKFGGTSLADADRIRHVAELVCKDPGRRFIVLSAPGKRDAADDKITDLLYCMIDGGRIDRSIFSRIFQRYAEIRDSLAPAFDLESEFDRILEHDPRDADYFASRGEYLLAKLFAEFTGWTFLDAADLIFFDERGAIDISESARACVENLLPLCHAVIPGFYGRNPDGGIHVFDRGGSDVSGAWIAALLKADLYENWTDVGGIYSADPAVIALPRHCSCISYARAESILRSGASVLHPDAIAPLRCAGIECRILNTFSPEDEPTRICACSDDNFPCVTGFRDLCASPLSPAHAADKEAVYADQHGNAPLSIVCAFGLNASQISKIESEIRPIHIIHMQEQVQIIIPQVKFVETLHAVHRILTE